MSTLGLAAAVAGSVLSIAVTALVVGDYRLVTRLRRDHAAVWQALGSPSPWFTKFEDLTAINRFLAQRRYEDLSDPELIGLARRLRLLTSLVYWLAAITLILLGIARVKR